MRKRHKTKREFLEHLFNHVWINERGCWVCFLCISTGGYIKTRLGGESVYGHRLAYELEVGGIPDGLWVLHDCDTPSCINPMHLKAGTPLENSADRELRGRGRRVPAQGERCGRSKLKEWQVLEIRDKKSLGRSLNYLAREYGVSQRLVHFIVHRKIWKHI